MLVGLLTLAAHSQAAKRDCRTFMDLEVDYENAGGVGANRTDPAPIYRMTNTLPRQWPVAKPREISKNNRRQRSVSKDQGECSGFVLRVSKLIIRWETAPRYQEIANPSQKPTSASNMRKTFRRSKVLNALISTEF